MKRFILIFFSVLLCFSCKTIQYVPIHDGVQIEYRDTTIIKDSLIYTPVEVIKEIVPELDTLKMSTSLAEAEAYLDTTNKVLRGSIKNKKGITEQIKWREKIVYRDSIETKEIPVEVEVTKEVKTHFWYEKLLWAVSILSILYFAIKILLSKYGKLFRL